MSPTFASAPGSPRSAWSRRLALVALCAGMLMVVLDGSIVTVALPAIQQDLRFSPSGLTWTVNAYLIPFGGLLLLSGRLGDLIGRKRVLLAGLAVFTVASLLCGLAGSAEMLIATRFLQGVGGAMFSAVSLGMIVTLFTDPRERASAIGAFAFTGAVGASIGQVLGGVLTDALGWHWVFLINLPIGVVAALLAVPLLENERGLGLRDGADALGAVLVTGGSMLGVYAIVQAEQYGWASGRTLGLAAVALALIAGFVVRQAVAARPLLPLRVFRSRNVWGANVIQMLVLAAMFSFQIHVALYMQSVLEYGATATGLAMLPAALTIGAVSLGSSARLIARFGDRAVLLAGLLLLLAARLLLLRLPVDGAYAADLLPVMLLTGGAGLVLPALTGLGMSGARPEDAGVTSGLFNATQQIGAALGVAALSTLAASRTQDLAAEGVRTASALTGGYHLAFVVGGVLLAVAVVLTVLVLRKPATETPEAAGQDAAAPATVA
ncbi:MFS transporter [Planotetraspora kaengkrachanensis]|uniref:MFS transporter n=1 Tax=Planotetraspora kaengkrachanensis TaxID=575193 RepID=A0A8J3M705_9ACTN|nr:MFS transporter [Planotetraspora kaengkrachanensis]GIG78405.1 MFS transporter [Planotetraspora kaengkrachanensis]